VNTAQIIAYISAILTAGVTVGLALRIARISARRHFWAYLLYILTSNIVCLLDLVFRSFLWQVTGFTSSITPQRMDMLMGFLMVPLVAAFAILFAAFIIGLVGRRAPVILQRIYGIFWVLLFIGFLAAEITYFNSGDRTLTNVLNPVFNFGILAGMLYALIFAYAGSRQIEDTKEKLLIRGIIIYYLFSFFLFFTWNTSHVPLNIKVSVLARSLFGLVYNLPPLIFLNIVLRSVYKRPTIEPERAENLDRWLKDQKVSPREREIIQLVLLGKSNRSIEKELFISRRTVESHLYNVYKKLGIKNRIQLMRILNEKSQEI
jgi:DNA-binding CsgD family transcriptional regulator/succinate dehydrogenase hydrophobic anchor subunit